MSAWKGGLECELEWIDKHPERYFNKQHQEIVKTNITIRYKTTEMLHKIDKVIKEFTV